MPFALTLRLDPDAANRIAALWEALATAGLDSDRAALGYPAHLTLAIYPDDAPPDALAAALAALAPAWRSLPLPLAGLGLFPMPSPILWVAPAPSRALLAQQAALLAALPAVEPDPHYRVDVWVPHITVSGPLTDPAAALRRVLPLWQPLTAMPNRAELVRFRPVQVLHGVDLAPGW